MTILLTIREACAELGVCRDTLRRMIRSRKLRAVRPTPRAVRIPRSSIEQWVEGGAK